MTLEGIGKQIPPEEDVERKKRSAEALKVVSKEDGIEVLENLDINEKNVAFASKMRDIEEEMKKRRIVLKMDNDTGKPLKEGKTEFEALKEETKKQTVRELTRTSKYVRAAVIGGLVAGIAYTMGETSVINDFIANTFAGDAMKDSTNPSTWIKVFEGAEITELLAIVGGVGTALWKGGKAISQEIKTRVVTNQKVQRVIAMMAGGINQKTSQKVVGRETKQYDSVWGNVDKESFLHGGYDTVNSLYDDSETGMKNKEIIKGVREKLDEMGIQRVSREKYKG